jgi:hypothetical protein
MSVVDGGPFECVCDVEHQPHCRLLIDDVGKRRRDQLEQEGGRVREVDEGGILCGQRQCQRCHSGGKGRGGKLAMA